MWTLIVAWSAAGVVAGLGFAWLLLDATSSAALTEVLVVTALAAMTTGSVATAALLLRRPAPEPQPSTPHSTEITQLLAALERLHRSRQG